MLGVAWNLFLALIPVALAFLIVRLAQMPAVRAHVMAKVGLGALVVIWLAFLPNTCYLLTEWRHYLSELNQSGMYSQWAFGRDHSAMLWLINNAIYFFGYSMFGMITFALAIRPMAQLARRWVPRVWLLGIPLFPLLALGVYLGLVLRYNSWDLVTRPDIVLRTIQNTLVHPFLLPLILVFGAFLWLAYFVLDVWIDGFRVRFTRLPQ